VVGLTNDLYAIIFTRSLDDGRLFDMMEALRDLPDTDLPEAPGDPGAADFLEHIEDYPVMVNGLDVVFDAYRPGRDENLVGAPDDLGYLVMSTQQSSVLGMPGEREAFVRLLQEAFVALDATFAVTMQEYELTATEPRWEDLRFHTSGVMILSKPMVDAVGADRVLAAAPEAGVLGDGGVWLRFQEEFFYGMPVEYHEGMRALLGEMWERADGP
jgi:hypothetical protein